MKPSVSIITPSYNSDRFIEETIKSVLLQTFQDWEMLIVDDCSKDNTVSIVKEYTKQDSRIKLLINRKNKGAAETRNVALRLAKGRFIAFLDSDDVWYPQKLEKQLSFMTEKDIAFSFSSYEIIESDGRSKGKVINVPSEIDYEGYLKNTIIGCLTVIIDKEKVGCFEMPNIKSSHDMALWLLIMRRGFKAYGVKECLAKYRLVSTSNTAKKTKAAKDVWKVYRKVEGLSFIKSFISFVGYAFNAVKKRL